MMRKMALAAVGVATMAGAAAAQEAGADTRPFCSGNAAEWLGGSETAAMLGADSAPLMEEGTATGTSSTTYAFRVDGAAQDLRIEAMAANGDPMIRLTAPDGRVLAENDDYGGTLNAQAIASVGPGDYCVELSSVTGDPLNATLQVSRMDQAALLPEAVDTTLNACLPDTASTPFAEGPLDAAVAGGAVVQDIGAGVAYLRFDVAGAASLTLRAESEMLDPRMALYDAAGTLIAENDDTDGLNARLDFLTALAPGSYCLAAGPLSPGEGSIAVTAEALDTDSYLRGAWSRGELSPPVGADYPVEAIDLATTPATVVLHDGPARWLAFELPTETVLVATAHGQLLGADTRLALFAADGTPVMQADDTGGSLDATLGPVVLEAGAYRLAVLDIGRTEGPGQAVRPIFVTFARFARME